MRAAFLATHISAPPPPIPRPPMHGLISNSSTDRLQLCPSQSRVLLVSCPEGVPVFLGANFGICHQCFMLMQINNVTSGLVVAGKRVPCVEFDFRCVNLVPDPSSSVRAGRIDCRQARWAFFRNGGRCWCGYSRGSAAAAKHQGSRSVSAPVQRWVAWRGAERTLSIRAVPLDAGVRILPPDALTHNTTAVPLRSGCRCKPECSRGDRERACDCEQ